MPRRTCRLALAALLLWTPWELSAQEPLAPSPPGKEAAPRVDLQDGMRAATEPFRLLSPDELLPLLRDQLLLTAPKAVTIIVLALFALWLVRWFSNRLARVLTSRGSETAERRGRTRTLVSVFQNTASVAILLTGLLSVLDTVGIPIAPLLGSAAVVGLAVAFGAQNLIKDWFTGFMILLENQYALNEVVNINGIGGVVERITLRVTVLRNFDGHVTYIPNGQITTVTNLTSDWARAVVDVRVPFSEPLERAFALLREIGDGLREDPAFRAYILGPTELPGVEALTDSAVVVRMALKVRADKQWETRRELLKRIKLRFDERGISMPVPQQKVRYELAEGARLPIPDKPTSDKPTSDKATPDKATPDNPVPEVSAKPPTSADPAAGR